MLALTTLALVCEIAVSIPAPPGMAMSCLMAPSCFNNCKGDQVCHIYTKLGDDCPIAECKDVQTDLDGLKSRTSSQTIQTTTTISDRSVPTGGSEFTDPMIVNGEFDMDLLQKFFDQHQEHFR